MIDALIGYLQAHPEEEPLGRAAQMAELFLRGASESVSHPGADNG